MKAEEKCKNCSRLLEPHAAPLECELSGFVVSYEETCDKFDPCFLKVCGICGAVAAWGENDTLVCGENRLHMGSIWDGEWYDYELQKGAAK